MKRRREDGIVSGDFALVSVSWDLRPLHRDEVAARVGLRPRWIQRFVRLGVIEPMRGTTELFQPEVTLRIQRLMRLHRDLGVNFTGAALALDLLDRIERLEIRLRHFERT